MDTQKERELFENWWVEFNNGRQISCDYVSEDNSYSVGYANAQWVAWQAAKAQVKPEASPAIKSFREILDKDGILNIQDEREAFENQLTIDGFVKFDGYSFEKDKLGFYKDERVECSWHTYKLAHRRALKLALPGGFILLPVECTDEIAEAIAFSANVCGGIAGDVYASIIKVVQEQN